jgi:molybdopterin converting factor small subunit
MARVFLPSQMRDLTGGLAEVEVAGGSLRQLIDALEGRFPGFAARVLRDGKLAPGLAVSIDGEITTRGLLAPVGPESEVHFVAAISGG